ncbi:hypothetical protein [Bradyrhizobium stylosanthis]|uniref:hypothetical protein n=1 Tax=Bradyrhizobium stylosanthis TaxID=1803665 RepID=UPI0011A640E3|nr:hypothetical protein [Bradyrhizobium stylosanthis]
MSRSEGRILHISVLIRLPPAGSAAATIGSLLVRLLSQHAYEQHRKRQLALIDEFLGCFFRPPSFVWNCTTEAVRISDPVDLAACQTL